MAWARFGQVLAVMVATLAVRGVWADDPSAPAAAAGQPMSPTDSLAAITLPSELQAELVASEPLIHQVAAITFDEHGRLFVAEASGVIRVLEDSEGDGLFEKASVFAEGWARPRALAAWEGGVFVLSGADLLYLKDTNADGRADVTVPVLTGFGEDVGSAAAATLCWGLDGRLHGQAGPSGGKIRRADAPNDVAFDLSGVGFVFDPMHHDVEAEFGYGPRGMAFDAWGRRYVSADKAPVEVVLGDSGHLNISPEDAGVQATGLAIYQGDAWPSSFAGNVFVLDAANNAILRRSLDTVALPPAMHNPDPSATFLQSRDTGFHPVQAIGGPDGNLYVLDAYGDGSNADLGRIYRIAPKGVVHEKRKLPGEASPPELVDMLAHPNAWHRETAARLIQATHDAEQIRALEACARNASLAEARVRALYLLSATGVADEHFVAEALSSGEAMLRFQGLRMAGAGNDGDPLRASTIIALTDDDNAWVRLEAIRQLGSVWLSRRTAPLVRACLRDGGVPAIQPAILFAAKGVAPEVLRGLCGEAAFQLSAENSPLVRDLARVATREPTFDSSSGLRLLESLPGDAADLRKDIVLGFAAEAGNTGRLDLLKALLEAQSPFSEVMAHYVVDARSAALDASAKLDDRLGAVALLSTDSFDNAGALLRGLIAPTEAVQIQLAAVRSLASLGGPGVAPLLLSAWPSLGPEVRRQVIGVVFANTEYIGGLLSAAEAGTITVDTLMQFGLPDLLKHPNILIRQRVSALIETAPREPLNDTQAVYQKLQKLTASKENGAVVFKDNCSMCHRVNGEGTKVAPDLDFMAKAGAYKVLENVLNPNLIIVPEFFSYTIETNDLQSITGIIAKEDAGSILVRGPKGEEHVVTRDNISSVTCAEKSLMLIGWEDSIGDQKLADLIAFLVDVVQKPKPVDAP